MRFSRSLLFRASLAGVLLLSPTAAFSSNPTLSPKFVGVYFSRSHDAGRSGSFMNLSLGPDGSATVTEDPGTGMTTTLFGHWAVSSNGVTIQFDPQEGKPPVAAMAFASSHDELQATTWDRSKWGKETPPPMKKGGAKVKELYWFNQNR